MNRAYIIKTDGTQQDLDARPTLEEAQQIVGGYIELLPIKGTRLTLVVNEYGKLLNLPLNTSATNIYLSPHSFIVGDVIVLEGWKTVG